MYTVFVLNSEGYDRIYVGMSNDADKRLDQHNRGENKSTKAYLPWVKIHEEAYDTRPEARKREKYLKSYRGRQKIRNEILPKYLAG